MSQKLRYCNNYDYYYMWDVSGFELNVMAADLCKCRRSLKYGTLILGAMAALTGGLFSAHFRQRMLLRHRARMASYVPTMVIPFITTTAVQDFITYRQLLGQKPQCQLCTNVNAVSAQVHMFFDVPF